MSDNLEIKYDVVTCNFNLNVHVMNLVSCLRIRLLIREDSTGFYEAGSYWILSPRFIPFFRKNSEFIERWIDKGMKKAKKKLYRKYVLPKIEGNFNKIIQDACKKYSETKAITVVDYIQANKK